jgi:hypothetical protein
MFWCAVLLYMFKSWIIIKILQSKAGANALGASILRSKNVVSRIGMYCSGSGCHYRMDKLMLTKYAMLYTG